MKTISTNPESKVPERIEESIIGDTDVVFFVRIHNFPEERLPPVG